MSNISLLSQMLQDFQNVSYVLGHSVHAIWAGKRQASQ